MLCTIILIDIDRGKKYYLVIRSTGEKQSRKSIRAYFHEFFINGMFFVGRVL